MALLLLLGTGCALGPNYQRPKVEVANAWKGEAASLADQPWWEVFGDPVLKDLIGQALAANFDVRAAAQRVEEYRARAGMERTDYLPSFTPGVGWLRGRSSPYAPGGGGKGTDLNAQVGMAWELDLWGQLRRMNEAAQAQYLAAEYHRRGVYLATAAQVAQAYFELRELDGRLAIAQSTAKAFQDTYDLFDRRLQGGAASSLETARAAAALDEVSGVIPDLERQIRAKENLLSLLVGRNPGPIPRGAELAAQAMPPQIPAGLPSALLERRPDLLQAEQQLVAANAAIGVAQANYFPTLSLTGLLGGLAPRVSQLFGSGREWDIGAGLNGPSLQGLRLKYQKAAVVAQWEQSRAGYEQAVTGAFGEVSTLLEGYQKLAEVEAQQAKAVAAYQQAVQLATLRDSAGLSSYLEVLEAQQQLFPAENTRSQVRLARLVTLVQLYKALGGGWNLENPTAWKAR
jgi:multidrug efflux system outer membrane protein